jgi:type III secretion protein W
MRLTDAAPVRPLFLQPSSSKVREPPSDDVADPIQPSMLDIAQDGAEEMSQLRSMFASRRDFEKKRGVADESFDQVLESDAAEKVDRVVALAELAEALLRFAMEMFPDDSDLVLVLRELVRRKKVAEAAQAKLEAALEQAEAHADPKALKAGINVALKARLFGARLAANPQNLRQNYRQFLNSMELAGAQYQSWVTEYGVDRRVLVVDFIESALFTDMHALDPSCTRREFGNLMGGLRQLRMLRTCDLQFVRSLRAAWQMEDGLSLMLLLEVLQQPYALQEVLLERLGEDARQAVKRARSVLMQALLRNFNAVPAELFALDDARDFVLEQLAELADKAYRIECRRV